MLEKFKDAISGGNYTQKILNEGIDLFSKEKFKESLNRFNKCIEISPNLAAPYGYKSWIYAIYSFELDEALKCIKKCHQLYASSKNNKHTADILNVLGEIHLRKGDYTNAIGYLTKCLEARGQNFSDDQNYNLFYRIGISYFSIQEYASANSYLLKAVALNPKNPQIYFTTGETCLALASYSLAKDYYGKAISLASNWNFNYPIPEIHPDNEEYKRQFLYVSLVNQGAAYDKMGDDDNCLKCNEEAYAIFPNEATAPINIAEIYSKIKCNEKVRLYLEYGIPLINPDHHKNLMISLLHFEAIEYQDIVLQLLLKHKKISQEDYDKHSAYLKKIHDQNQRMKNERPCHINIERLTMGNETNRSTTIGKVGGGYSEGNTTYQGPSVGIAQGPVDFGSAQNVADFVKELQKLRQEIVKAKKTNTMDEETASKIENHVNDAIAQSSTPTPDKNKIVNSLDKASNIAKSLTGLVESTKPIIEGLVWAGKLASKFFI